MRGRLALRGPTGAPGRSPPLVLVHRGRVTEHHAGAPPASRRIPAVLLKPSGGKVVPYTGKESTSTHVDGYHPQQVLTAKYSMHQAGGRAGGLAS